MTYRTTLFLLFAVLLTCTAWGDPARKANPKDILFPEAAFCVAYVLRSTDERDVEVDYAEKPKNPDEFGFPGGGILSEDKIIDHFSMAALVQDRATLSRDQAVRLTKSLLESRVRFPIMECYNPHHAVVFYSKKNEPIGCLEICFSCNTIKLSPRPAAVPWDKFYEPVDLFALAGLFSELKLSLAPYKSLEDFTKAKKKEVKPIEITKESEAAPSDGEKPSN